jgi:GNAT superfamily N-acetyltransferase
VAVRIEVVSPPGDTPRRTVFSNDSPEAPSTDVSVLVMLALWLAAAGLLVWGTLALSGALRVAALVALIVVGGWLAVIGSIGGVGVLVVIVLARVLRRGGEDEFSMGERLQMNLEVKAARPGDLAWLFDLHRAAHRALVEVAYQPWKDVEQQRYVAAMVSDFDVFIMENLDGRVGAIYLGVRGDDVWVEMIQVLPAQQGNGVGTAALRWIARRAAGQSRGVRLQVHHMNPRARALYERMGFMALETTDTHQLMRRSADFSRR